jgi:hypothetical protein
MTEIIMELQLLYNKMNEANSEVEGILGNEELPFSKVLYAVTRNIKNSDLFDMTDEELLKHIQRTQLIES